MLSKQFRLPGGYRLNAQHTERTAYFLVKSARHSGPSSRFGFIISKRVDKRATERNRLRRVLSQAILEKKEAIASGYDMLFIVRPEAAGVEAEILRQAVSDILKKIYQP